MVEDAPIGKNLTRTNKSGHIRRFRLGLEGPPIDKNKPENCTILSGFTNSRHKSWLQTAFRSQCTLERQVNMSAELLEWFIELPEAWLDVVLSNDSTADRSTATMFGPQNEPKHKCDVLNCNKAFDTLRKLSTHRYAAHRIVHPLRSLVSSETCPSCKTTFKSIVVAKRHFATICGLNATPQLLNLLQHRRDHPAPPDDIRSFFAPGQR